MANPLSRREVLKFGAYTTVGGVLTPGISLAQAIVTDTKGIIARDIQLSVGGTMIPAYDARPEAPGRSPVIVVISGFTGNSEHHKDVVRRLAHAGVDAFSLIPRIKAPVLGLYGEADGGIPAEDVKRFEAELKKTHPSVEFVLYPGAPHAFFSDDRPQVYKKEAAEDGWKRCLAFFAKHLHA